MGIRAARFLVTETVAAISLKRWSYITIHSTLYYRCCTSNWKWGDMIVFKNLLWYLAKTGHHDGTRQRG